MHSLLNQKPIAFLSHVFFLLLVLLLPTKATSSNQQATGDILVTLKPLYSLVAHLTQDISSPEILIGQFPASHHYHLKPSERRQLANAKLIIWFGPAMEGYLEKIIEQQKKNKSTVITALEADDINFLIKRGNTHHQHSNKNSAPKIDENQKTEQLKTIDPHVWLSTHNAKAISKHIAQSLIAYDAQNKAIYEKNLTSLLAKIENTKAFINETLSTEKAIHKKPFISYHDAFQYFEYENQLNHIGTVSNDEETGVSMKHLQNIKKLVLENKIKCLVYQEPKPAIVDSLTTQTMIRASALDPIGQSIQYSEDNLNNAWFLIMNGLATGFQECLSH